jgi:hypothetical protein
MTSSTTLHLVAGLFILSLAIAATSSLSFAQNKTSKRPDIVFECRNADSVKAPNCTMSCNDYAPTPANIPGTPGPPPTPAIIFPRAITYFERIEFFSQVDRTSENWVVILIGYRQSLGQSTLSVKPIFLTLGSGNICSYIGMAGADGNEQFSVQMIDYYGQN